MPLRRIRNAPPTRHAHDLKLEPASFQTILEAMVADEGALVALEIEFIDDGADDAG